MKRPTFRQKMANLATIAAALASLALFIIWG